MRNYLAKSLLTLVCLTMVMVPAPVSAQTSDLGLTIRVSPSTAAPGSTVGVISFVTNNTSSKLRTTVTFTSLSPCGVVTSIGYHRLSLDPGQTMMVTATYPIAVDACLGTYTVSISGKGSGGGGKGASTAATPSASAFLTIQ